MTNRTHGQHKTGIWMVWRGMKARCTDPESPSYPHYGGRGITFDPAWSDFQQFRLDMGPRPPGTTLDRIDNNGNYCASNCRWATRREQQDNRSITVNATIFGRTNALMRWCEKAGANYKTVYTRFVVNGWPIELALFAPRGARLSTWRRIATTPQWFADMRAAFEHNHSGA